MESTLDQLTLADLAQLDLPAPILAARRAGRRLELHLLGGRQITASLPAGSSKAERKSRPGRARAKPAQPDSKGETP